MARRETFVSLLIGGRDTPPIPHLRPFDSAQGERNAPHLDSCGGRNDGYVKVSKG